MDDVNAIKAEIYTRGPIKAAVNGTAIKNYTGGIYSDSSLENMGHSHGVSIVGWGYDPDTKRQHWIVRNSWGQYWGELGKQLASKTGFLIIHVCIISKYEYAQKYITILCIFIYSISLLLKNMFVCCC